MDAARRPNSPPPRFLPCGTVPVRARIDAAPHPPNMKLPATGLFVLCVRGAPSPAARRAIAPAPGLCNIAAVQTRAHYCCLLVCPVSAAAVVGVASCRLLPGGRGTWPSAGCRPQRAQGCAPTGATSPRCTLVACAQPCIPLPGRAIRREPFGNPVPRPWSPHEPDGPNGMKSKRLHGAWDDECAQMHPGDVTFAPQHRAAVVSASNRRSRPPLRLRVAPPPPSKDGQHDGRPYGAPPARARRGVRGPVGWRARQPPSGRAGAEVWGVGAGCGAVRRTRAGGACGLARASQHREQGLGLQPRGAARELDWAPACDPAPAEACPSRSPRPHPLAPLDFDPTVPLGDGQAKASRCVWVLLGACQAHGCSCRGVRAPGSPSPERTCATSLCACPCASAAIGASLSSPCRLPGVRAYPRHPTAAAAHPAPHAPPHKHARLLPAGRRRNCIWRLWRMTWRAYMRRSMRVGPVQTCPVCQRQWRYLTLELARTVGEGFVRKRACAGEGAEFRHNAAPISTCTHRSAHVRGRPPPPRLPTLLPPAMVWRRRRRQLCVWAPLQVPRGLHAPDGRGAPRQVRPCAGVVRTGSAQVLAAC